MSKYRLVIPGIPIPWARPAGRIHRYDSQKKEKEIVRLQLRYAARENRYQGHLLDHGEHYAIKLYFYIPVPRSCNTSEKNAKLWGFEVANEKPDVDNLTKFYLDCANGILWSDDKRIIEAHPKKVYSENPRTIIEIMTKQNLSVPSNVEGILRVFGPQQLKEFARNVKQLSYLTEEQINESVAESEKPNKERWLAWTALLLSRFAQAHAEDLKKITKFKDIEIELKQMQIEVPNEKTKN